MIHLGDITKIKGSDASAVNVIIGGSPCQDLSVAGKRAGLAGERSGLFMEQIRIIKEMREKDAESGRTGTDIRPRFMVWENVIGAFSSTGGRDFAAVLEETIKVVEQEIPDIPVPDKGWPTAGAIRGMDGRWSVAWRVLDAQYWGVPQRRRRIALVADFGGTSAPEILFERESLRGGSAQSGTQRQGTAENAERCSTTDDRTGDHGSIICLQGNGIDRADTAGCNGKGWNDQTCYTLNTIDRPAVAYDARGNGNESTVPTLTGDHENRVTDYTAVVVESVYAIGNGQADQTDLHEKTGTLNCMHDQQAVMYKEDTPFRQGGFGDFVEGEFGTLRASGGDYGGGTETLITENRQKCIVRRLTPLEAERLQGFPDGWTDIGEWTDDKGKKHQTSDSARYKALGNSIAIPPWTFVLSRLILYTGLDDTMASLFDDIGGFPLIWGRLGGRTLWASEIESFPIAVTKRRIE